MKKLIFICLAFFSLPLLAQGGWEPLFNGKNLKGWEKAGGTADYKVENGAIVGISKMKTPNTFLVTKTLYTDFILELEFKSDSELNSGIQFRSKVVDKAVTGLQFELDPAERAWSGGIYDERGRSWLYPLKGLNEPARKAYKEGDWNKIRIEAIGTSVRTWLNGIPCADIIDEVKTGFIGLQVHGIGKEELAGQKLYWRNIRICTTNIEQERTSQQGQIAQINCIDNTLSEKEKANGWMLLWDGKTNKGWRSARSNAFPLKGWNMENGELIVAKADGSESTNGGDIITTEKYGDFELLVDFKITEGANSGIKYFVDPEMNQGAGSSIGCEYQILDDLKHPDAKLGVKGNRTIASLYDLIPADQDKPFYGVGTWNHARIVSKGNKVEHWLNGVKVVEYERNTQMWRALVAYSKYKDWPAFGEAKEGNILLQDHGDKVFFKNIKIKKLK